MRNPNDGSSVWWPWVVAGVLCLAAGAAWAEGVLVLNEDEGSAAAWLGVRLTEEVDHPEGGARVVGVIDGSPAEEAGIEEGDVIQGFDGEAVRGPGGLSKRIEAKAPGDRASIRLLRDGRETRVDVELGERDDLLRWHTRGFVVPPEDAEKWSEWAEEFGEEYSEKWAEKYSEKWSEWAEEFGDSVHLLPHGGRSDVYFLRSFGRPKLGVQLSEATPELREHFGGDADTGVLISKVLPEMPAAEAGLRVGDLIVAIDGEPVATSREIVRELRDKEGESFPIEVIRDGRALSIEVTIPERETPTRPTGPRAFYVRPALPPLPPLPALPALPELPPLPELPGTPELPALPEQPALPALPAPPAPPVVAGPADIELV
jgi:predicted metalloprotease with PDZ domain